MKCGHLILRNIFKFVAIRCRILRLKCTELYFGWGAAPYPAGRSYSASPDTLAGFKGLLLRKGKGRSREWKGTGAG